MGVNLECPGALTLGSRLLDGDCFHAWQSRAIQPPESPFTLGSQRPDGDFFHGRQNPSDPAPLGSPSLGEEASIGRRYWVISNDQGPELRECPVPDKNRRITMLSHSHCYRVYLSLFKSPRNHWACTNIVSAKHN